MSLFVTANHMLLVYCIIYAIGDLVRAVQGEEDSSSSAMGVSVLFFILSIFLLLNSVVYYKAFMQEQEEEEFTRKLSAQSPESSQSQSQSDSNGEGGGAVDVTVGAAAALDASTGGGSAGTGTGSVHLSHSDSDAESTALTLPRSWTFWLNTEAGWAYFLNILGSLGYLISSLISLFLTAQAVYTARETDKASLWLDTFNMAIFIFDAFLFWRVWARETEESKRVHSVYFWANICNVLSSVCYLAFIIWTLREHYALEEEEAAHVAAGDPDWYDREMSWVSRKQRSMYLAGDIIYLVYAILLELGWSTEHKEKMMASAQRRERQLKELV